ncbi:MAG: hypothetical protein LBV45_03470, partial [Xanthomonadaceae bacterium]|nr:hypothetical protein [Xanthomonadaceae bacterium]
RKMSALMEPAVSLRSVPFVRVDSTTWRSDEIPSMAVRGAIQAETIGDSDVKLTVAISAGVIDGGADFFRFVPDRV